MNGKEVCVCYFVEILGQSQPKISRHLAYLRRAGIVTARREGKWMHYKIVVPGTLAPPESFAKRSQLLGRQVDAGRPGTFEKPAVLRREFRHSRGRRCRFRLRRSAAPHVEQMTSGQTTHRPPLRRNSQHHFPNAPRCSDKPRQVDAEQPGTNSPIQPYSPISCTYRSSNPPFTPPASARIPLPPIRPRSSSNPQAPGCLPVAQGRLIRCMQNHFLVRSVQCLHLQVLFNFATTKKCNISNF